MASLEPYASNYSVLDRVFETKSESYLTGGACLRRFYQAKRNSFDTFLDTFDEKIQNIIQIILDSD